MIIGLAGRAGSGKSTCAAWLRDRRGAIEFSLAQPLKLLAQDVFDFSDEQVFGTQEQKEAVDPRWGISPRVALIRLGHGARERLGDRVWIDACLGDVARSGVALAVIADVRYPNEAEAIATAGGRVIRLRCPDAQSVVDPNAPSERGVDEIDQAHVSAEICVARSPGAALLIQTFASAVSPFLPRVA